MALRTAVNTSTQLEMYNYVLNDQELLVSLGISSIGDSVPSLWYYDINSSATDNGNTVIQPSSVMGNGRWLRIATPQYVGDWNQSSSSALDYIKNKPTIPAAQIQSDWNQSNSSSLDFIKNKPTITSGTVTSVTVSSSDFAISGSPVTSSGTIIANLNTSGVSAGTYSGVTVNNKGIVTAGTSQSISSPSRTINTTYQNTSSQNILGSYTVDISCTFTLLGGQQGSIYLEYADNSTFSTNLVTVQSSTNGNTGTIGITITLTQTATAAVTGVIPAGKYYRIRSNNDAGTPTFTMRNSQETKI